MNLTHFTLVESTTSLGPVLSSLVAESVLCRVVPNIWPFYVFGIRQMKMKMNFHQEQLTDTDKQNKNNCGICFFSLDIRYPENLLAGYLVQLNYMLTVPVAGYLYP